MNLLDIDKTTYYYELVNTVDGGEFPAETDEKAMEIAKQLASSGKDELLVVYRESNRSDGLPFVDIYIKGVEQ